MSIDVDKLILSEKFGVTFQTEETIRLVCKPNPKACLGNELKNILSVFFFLAGTIGFFQIIAYLYKSTFDWWTTSIFIGITSLLSVFGSIWTILKLRAITSAGL